MTMESGMFEHILKWKLLRGSHEFPGPDGGTCITEAAIVAAGFKYRSVGNGHSCPPCFSRPIAVYAIGLNDAMPDGLRQRLLLPFVTRLAGTADEAAVEKARAELIVVRTVRDILPIVLWSLGLGESAKRCEAVGDLVSAAAACEGANVITATAHASGAIAYATRAATSAYDYAAAAYDAAVAASRAAYRVAGHAAALVAQERIFSIAVSILDEAIRLGKQADPIETALVVERMERAKVLA